MVCNLEENLRDAYKMMVMEDVCLHNPECIEEIDPPESFEIRYILGDILSKIDEPHFNIQYRYHARPA